MSGILPTSWVQTELQCIAEIAPKFDASDVGDHDLVHFVPMAAVAEEFGGADVSQLRPLSEVRKGYTSFAAGDVLFAKITPCMENGKGALVPRLAHRYAFGSTEFHIIRPTEAVSGEWLAYFLSQPEFRKIARRSMTGTAGQLRVPTKWLRSAIIPVPPRVEQTRIVAKLDELFSGIDAAVAELKAAQRKLRQYRQLLLNAAVEGALTIEWRKFNLLTETGPQLLERILQERRARWEAKQLAKFKDQGKTPPSDWQTKYQEPIQPDDADLPTLPDGWVWASVDQLLSHIETGKSFKCEERPPRGDEVGVAKVSAVTWGEYNEYESKTCHDESMIRSELFVRAGDFLFSRANTIDLVGACVIAKHATKRVMLSDKILRLILVEDALKEWLLAALRSELGRKYIEAFASGNQESMRNIGQERLRQIPVPLPPMREINHSMELLSSGSEAAQSQESAIRSSLNQSAAQRQNILRAAFVGQLVPQDPNDEPASRLLEHIRVERAEREKQPKVRKTKQHKGIAAVVSKLIDVLAEAGDWVPAQETFRRCGVADGAQTEQVEALYAELRALDKAGLLAVEAVTDTEGRKLHDRLMLLVT